MAYMMRICGLFERNASGDNPYRYMTGQINGDTRVVVMPNREKNAAGDPDWILYLAPLARGNPDRPAE